MTHTDYIWYTSFVLLTDPHVLITSILYPLSLVKAQTHHRAHVELKTFACVTGPRPVCCPVPFQTKRSATQRHYRELAGTRHAVWLELQYAENLRSIAIYGQRPIRFVWVNEICFRADRSGYFRVGNLRV